MYDGKHQSSSIIHEYFGVSLIRLFIVQTPNYGWILSLKIWIQWTWSKLWGTIPNRYLIVNSRSCKCLGINRVETFFPGTTKMRMWWYIFRESSGTWEFYEWNKFTHKFQQSSGTWASYKWNKFNHKSRHMARSARSSVLSYLIVCIKLSLTDAHIVDAIPVRNYMNTAFTSSDDCIICMHIPCTAFSCKFEMSLMNNKN